METFLKIENIKLWARVGVLDEERELGQLFILDVLLWTDFEKCTLNDDIEKTVDYVASGTKKRSYQPRNSQGWVTGEWHLGSGVYDYMSYHRTKSPCIIIAFVRVFM